jgi:hypothetical protein
VIFAKIIFFYVSIITNDRGRLDAVSSLWCPGCLPDWQPTDYLDILKGVEKQPADDNWYTHLIKSVSGANITYDK